MQVSSSSKWNSGVCTLSTSQVSIRKATSCRSGADIKLSEFQQQLEVAETKCGSLKSQLDYMKMLYHGVQPETEGDNKTVEIGLSIEKSPSLKLSAKSITKIQEPDNFEESEDLKYCAFLEEIRKIQENASNERDGDKQTSRGSPALTVRLPEIFADSTDITDAVSKEDEPAGFLSETILDETKYIPNYSHQIRSVAQTSSPVAEKVYDEYQTDVTTNQHPYQKYLADYSAGLHREISVLKSSTGRTITANQNETVKESELPAAGAKSENPEIALEIIKSTGSVKGMKHKKTPKTDRKQKAVSSSGTTSKKSLGCKADEVNTTKIKRRKARVRCSASKSTVATKDTNLTGSRDIKRRKQKSYTIPARVIQDHLSPQEQQNRSEVVEIFRNELKSGSVSVVSSKHAMLYSRLKGCNKEPFLPNDRKKAHSPLDQSHNHEQQGSPTELQCHKSKTVPQEIRAAGESPGEKGNTTIANPTTGNCVSEGNKVHPYQPEFNASYYDPMAIRNYELPTLASKLKRSNRSYFNRFNFRNIPFVVGTSVTPSHNLGLNIQQVLSIMKSRQPAMSGMVPLLIRKVSRGMKPVSVLMELNEQSAKISQDTDYQMHDTNNQDRNVYSNELAGQFKDTVSLKLSKQLSIVQSLRSVQTAQNPSLHLRDKKQNNREDTASENKRLESCTDKNRQSNRYAYLSQPSANQMKVVKGIPSQRSVKLYANVSKDSRNMSSHSTHHSKGIREVLIKLHDQFEEMNTKYEKLQEKADKSNDKTIANEIAALEKELNAKEDEINAVVNLYKEVMALKQQMKMLQERNSFVCISAGVPALSKGNSSYPLATGGFRTEGNFHPLTPRRRNAFIAGREPSTSIRLAGLLRQIQTFQKQLQHA